MPERRLHRERWVGAMQRTGVPLRLINGVVDPLSGAHMLERYRQLVPEADTVLPGHRPLPAHRSASAGAAALPWPFVSSL